MSVLAPTVSTLAEEEAEGEAAAEAAEGADEQAAAPAEQTGE